jgi:hypothetical protein
MLFPSCNEFLLGHLPTPDETTFVGVKIQVSSFMVREMGTLVKIVSIWCKNTISILDELYLILDMIAQHLARCTNCQISVCKLHTPVSAFDVVIDSMHEMLLKPVL